MGATVLSRRRLSADVAVTAALVTISLFVHLWRLGLRPLAHDEAIDAWFSWRAGGGELIKYDPVYHGPLRFWLEGAVLHTMGTGAFWARLLAAVCGVAATGIIACSRATLGRVGAPVAALVFIVSPTVLTVTRTGREDSLTALIALGLLLVVARAAVRPRQAHIVAGAVLLALMWTVKESVFLFGLVALLFFVALGVIAALRPGGRCRAAVTRLAALGQQPWWWAATAFLAVFIAVFTSAFRYPGGVISGLIDGIRYWWGQHPVQRGGQPWFFYLLIYVSYEWLLHALAIVGLIATVRRRSVVGAWFATMWLGQVALYAWAGEKFAWLAVHPLIPAVLLAGIGAQAIFDRLHRRQRRSVPGAAAILAGVAAMSLAVAWGPAVTRGHDPRELLVAVHTSPDVPRVAAELDRAHRAGRVRAVWIDGRDGGSWPWVWYLHDLPVSYSSGLPTAASGDFDVWIIDGANDAPAPAVPGMSTEKIALRCWWTPDYSSMSFTDYARWFLTRRTWNDTACLPQYVLVKDGVLEDR